LGTIGQQVVLVLGWDGSMLAAIHKYHWMKIPFLGINYGNGIT
jgi:NAD kinase